MRFVLNGTLHDDEHVLYNVHSCGNDTCHFTSTSEPLHTNDCETTIYKDSIILSNVTNLARVTDIMLGYFLIELDEMDSTLSWFLNHFPEV